MRAYAAVLSMAIASGCVATAKDSFIGPSGGQTHSAKCSQSPQACLKAAGDTCKGSYAVLDSHSNAGGILADVLPGPVTWYSMTYQCGRGDGSFPQFPFRGRAHPSITNCQKFGSSVSCQSF